jgi:hypothetical protein
MKFSKRPVVIEATQWFKLGDHPSVTVLPSSHPAWDCPEKASLMGWIKTLEGGSDGAQVVREGDWIITGIQGEFYPCKPDIFAATYDPVELLGETLANAIIDHILACQQRFGKPITTSDVAHIIRQHLGETQPRELPPLPESPPDGVPCSHPGCLHHLSHPCEGCGRVGGRSQHLGERAVEPTQEDMSHVGNVDPRRCARKPIPGPADIPCGLPYGHTGSCKPDYHHDPHSAAEVKAYMDAANKEVASEPNNEEKLLQLADRAIGEHSAPKDCYSTGPMTGTRMDETCPACDYIKARKNRRLPPDRCGGDGTYAEAHPQVMTPEEFYKKVRRSGTSPIVYEVMREYAEYYHRVMEGK